MDLGTAQGTIRVVWDGSGVAQAKADLAGLGGVADQASAKSDAVGRALGGLGLAGVAAFGKMVNVAADFEASISNIASVGGKDAIQNIDAIRQTALDLGKDTSFSASEAASGMEELIKAGVPVADVLNGAAAAALDLSAATGVSVPEAATLMATGLNVFSDGMTGFTTEGEKATHIADLLAQTANASAADVHDLGLGFSQVANVADSFGISIDETAQALGLMSNAGLRGSDAGTSLKQALLSLLDPTKKQKEAMADLGLTYDSFYKDGQFIGLGNAFQLLGDSMEGLTDQQKQNTLAVMFGSDAYRAAKILTDAGVKGFENFAEAQLAAGLLSGVGGSTS